MRKVLILGSGALKISEAENLITPARKQSKP